MTGQKSLKAQDHHRGLRGLQKQSLADGNGTFTLRRGGDGKEKVTVFTPVRGLNMFDASLCPVWKPAGQQWFKGIFILET